MNFKIIVTTAMILMLPVNVTAADEVLFKRQTYLPASPEYALSFPRDHGSHPKYSYEWWYFTGHVASADESKSKKGPELAGFELTVFRISPLASDTKPSYLVAHLAWSDLETGKFRHLSFGTAEKKGIAEVATETLRIKMPGVQVALESPSKISLEVNVLWEGKPFELKTLLQSDKPVTLHGQRGYSKKADCAGCASHYSSFTRLHGPLTVRQNGQTRSLQSQVWFDHEFGSNSLAQSISGWDWFALQLSDGWDLMIYQLHDAQGKPARRSGTWIDPAGKISPIEENQIALIPKSKWLSPHTGATYPASWELSITHPAHPLQATLIPKLSDQEISSQGLGLATYWEGTCAVQSSGGLPLGDAYLEMTGYDPAGRPKF